jgi:outer membrane protein assembly factor BamB
VVKTLCAEALANINPELFKKETLSLLNSDEPRVRYKVALAFAKLGDKRSIEPLVSSISSVSQWESSLLDHFLRKLLPTNPPPVGLPQPELQKEWAKRTTDSSIIPEAQIAFNAKNMGKTLVVLLDAGRIIMLDSSNNILWKIDNLQFPLDAQILPDEKVLVAEHQGNKVTERNKKGEIIWEKKIDGPLAVQKLEDGSIFIASKTNIVFVDQKGKEISEFTPPNNEPIMKANIASNGDICLVLSTPQGNAKFVRFDKNKKPVATYDIDVRTSGGKVDILPNGNSLITEVYGNRVIEFNNEGKEVWKFECEQPVAAVRLPNGNTLVTSMTQMKALEIDPKGKEIWSYKSNTRVTRAFRP